LIDVMGPLVASGNAILAGEANTGPTVTLYELTYKLNKDPDGLKLFTLSPLWRDAPRGWSFPASLKEEGFADMPCGAVQHFFFRAADGPWSASQLTNCGPRIETSGRLPSRSLHAWREGGRAKPRPVRGLLVCWSSLSPARGRALGLEIECRSEAGCLALDGIECRGDRSEAGCLALDAHPPGRGRRKRIDAALRFEVRHRPPIARIELRQIRLRNVAAAARHVIVDVAHLRKGRAGGQDGYKSNGSDCEFR
jgi:hypothetical protein